MEELQEHTSQHNEQRSGVEPGFFAKIGREIRELARVLIIALVIVLPIRFFVAQPFVVRGASMEPNFYTGQYLIIDELSYYLRSPQRGEVIVFRYPRMPSEFFIKRIIGLPGEHVEVKGNVITITNKEHPEGFVLDETSYLPDWPNAFPGDITVTLSSDEYFVLGDNRPESSDSRRWGPLEKSFFVGRALVRLWPPQDMRLIEGASYN